MKKKTMHNIIKSKQNEKLLIIDGSNLAHRAFHKFSNIRSTTEGNVGLIYGFIKILRTYIVRFEPTRILVVFDTKKTKKYNLRLKAYPEYKAQRKARNLEFDYESFDKQCRILRSMLVLMKVAVLADNKGLGHEADDYIAHFAMENSCKVVIISSDKDFIQLLDRRRIQLYNPYKDDFITHLTAEKITGYDNETHLQYLILTGDSSDNIPGYKGIGPVKAKQFLTKFKTLQGFLDDPEASFPGVTKEGIEFLLKRNRYLIDLKFFLEKNPIKVDKLNIRSGYYKPEQLKEILYKFSMNTFLKPDFIQPFKALKTWKKLKKS